MVKDTERLDQCQHSKKANVSPSSLPLRIKELEVLGYLKKEKRVKRKGRGKVKSKVDGPLFMQQ